LRAPQAATRRWRAEQRHELAPPQVMELHSILPAVHPLVTVASEYSIHVQSRGQTQNIDRGMIAIGLLFVLSLPKVRFVHYR
jgi:hypothetical protein